MSALPYTLTSDWFDCNQRRFKVIYFSDQNSWECDQSITYSDSCSKYTSKYGRLVRNGSTKRLTFCFCFDLFPSKRCIMKSKLWKIRIIRNETLVDIGHRASLPLCLTPLCIRVWLKATPGTFRSLAISSSACQKLLPKTTENPLCWDLCSCRE